MDGEFKRGKEGFFTGRNMGVTKSSISSNMMIHKFNKQMKLEAKTYQQHGKECNYRVLDTCRSNVVGRLEENCAGQN